MFSQNIEYLTIDTFGILRHTAECYLYKDGRHSMCLETNVCWAVNNKSVPFKENII